MTADGGPTHLGDEMPQPTPRSLRKPCLATLAVLLFVSCCVATTLKSVATIEMPGPAGKRFDYLTVDCDDHYLLSAHLAAGLLYVVDLRTNKVVKASPDVPGVEGVEFVPELKKVYTSDSGDNTIGVIDLKQMKVIKKLPTEAKPDGSAYAAPFHKLYVSDERGKAEAIVDVRQDKIVKTLHFDSETGMPQYDPIARKIYVNLQDQNIFAVIDPQTDEVVGGGTALENARATTAWPSTQTTEGLFLRVKETN